MKKHYIILGLFCLLAIVACSDNDPVVEVNNGNQTEEELPPLPTEVITGSRAMWVSYDPAPNVDANNSSGISSALISWRLLKTDPSNVAFDIYKSVDGETEVKLNEKPISNTTSWVDADIDVSKTNVYRVTLANQAETLCDYTFTSEMAEKFYHEIRLMYNPQTGTLILGDEMYGKSICSSHAQEFHASQAEGRFDDYLRGWIGVSKSYPHGIVHFAPAVSMEQFDCGFDALQMFARLEGVNEDTIVRGFCTMPEQRMGDLLPSSL